MALAHGNDALGTHVGESHVPKQDNDLDHDVEGGGTGAVDIEQIEKVYA